jgi:anthranilate phosphoribosyltransferase
MLENQNIKIEIEKERVAAKKREEDFVFMTADTSHMDAEAKAWQHWYLFTFFG